MLVLRLEQVAEELEADHQDRVRWQDFHEVDTQTPVETLEALIAQGMLHHVSQGDVGLVALDAVVGLLVAQLHVVLLARPDDHVRVSYDAGTN